MNRKEAINKSICGADEICRSIELFYPDDCNLRIASVLKSSINIVDALSDYDLFPVTRRMLLKMEAKVLNEVFSSFICLNFSEESDEQANDSRASSRTDDQGKPAFHKRAKVRENPIRSRSNGAKRGNAANPKARKSALQERRGRK